MKELLESVACPDCPGPGGRGARGGSQSLLVGKNTRGWCGAETEDREATFPDVGGNSFEGFLK